MLLISSKTEIKNIPVTTRRRGRVVTKEKPAIISDYNNYMGGIDAFDMMLYSYLDERRTIKYWKKITFNFFSRMLLNAYILYQSTSKKMKLSLLIDTSLLFLSFKRLEMTG